MTISRKEIRDFKAENFYFRTDCYTNVQAAIENMFWSMNLLQNQDKVADRITELIKDFGKIKEHKRK